MFVIIAVPTIGGFLLMRGKLGTINRLQADAENKVRARLELVAGDLAGTIVAGPALETPRGKLELYASKAPKDTVVDVTKFSTPVPATLRLVVVRVEDAGKVPTKGLRPVVLSDPEASAAYRVLASDPEVAGRLFSADAARKLRSVEEGARGRARLRLVHGTATVTLTRGLSEAAELREFFNGCSALMDDLKKG